MANLDKRSALERLRAAYAQKRGTTMSKGDVIELHNALWPHERVLPGQHMICLQAAAKPQLELAPGKMLSLPPGEIMRACDHEPTDPHTCPAALIKCTCCQECENACGDRAQADDMEVW